LSGFAFPGGVVTVCRHLVERKSPLNPEALAVVLRQAAASQRLYVLFCPISLVTLESVAG